jgi:hypothetical protein
MKEERYLSVPVIGPRLASLHSESHSSDRREQKMDMQRGVCVIDLFGVSYDGHLPLYHARL